MESIIFISNVGTISFTADIEIKACKTSIQNSKNKVKF